jgi:hypothetical protein
MLKYNPENIEINNLKWTSVKNLLNIENRELYDYVSCHHYMRENAQEIMNLVRQQQQQQIQKIRQIQRMKQLQRIKQLQMFKR